MNFLSLNNLLYKITLFTLLLIYNANGFPINLNNILIVDNFSSIAVGENGAIIRTNDRGINWETIDPGITNILTGINVFQNENSYGGLNSVYIITADNGIILRSTDNCYSWGITALSSYSCLYDICTLKNGQMFICGAQGSLYNSYDFGLSWNKINLNITDDIYDISAVSSKSFPGNNFIIAVGQNGLILTSCDNGVSWNISSKVINTTLNSVTCANYNLVFAAGNNGSILRSGDMGKNWEILNSGVKEDLYRIKSPENNNIMNIVCSGENGTLLISEDNGDNWQRINLKLYDDLKAMDISSTGFGIAGGTNEALLYTTNGGSGWSTNVSKIFTASGSDDNQIKSGVYPNPFNPSTVISYTVNSSANVSIIIYDISGREIRTLESSFRTAGVYSINFNASNLASGIYFCIIRMDNGRKLQTNTMRLILTK